MRQVLTGSQAVSQAVRLCRPQVIAAYPITPQTAIVEDLAGMCADGRLRARFLKVESEHSVMSSMYGASAAGSRVFTATSSHGLAYMHEVLHWTAGARQPVVLANVNRALGPPWNILCDHQDSLSQRDTGWLQFYVESGQEALDTTIQAFALAERVSLPAMINLDGFTLSHTAEIVDVPEQEEVDAFLPPFEPALKLDLDHPRHFGSVCLDRQAQAFRKGIQEAMKEAREEARAVDAGFGRAFGRSHGLIEPFRVEGAELVLVAYGTVASTARLVVDRLAQAGRPVGLVKIRLFRPFPGQELREVLAGTGRVAVVDRNCSFGQGGIFAAELKNALYSGPNGGPELFSFIAGLGGQDVTPDLLGEIIDAALTMDKPPMEEIWMGEQP